MKLGEIKLEALKLMFVNNTNELNVSSITNLMQDENYASYLVNMLGPINRAIDRIKNAKVLTLNSKTLSIGEMEVSEFYLRYNLQNIEDFYLLDRVVYEDSDGEYIGEHPYQMEGKVIVLPKKEGVYRVLYYPSIPFVSSDVSDTDEINIPDEIARLIPYFIKSDLYQEDEPNLAADARNTFEACLEDLHTQQQGYTSGVEMKYTENS